MINTNITEEHSGSFVKATVSSDSSSSFTKLEKALFCGIGVAVTLFILQSLCFIVCIIRVKSKRRRKCDCSLISNVREPLSNEDNKSERYSSRQLKQVSDPQIYESLKDLITEAAPPLPPITTLPKRKPVENFQTSDTLRRCHADAGGNEAVNSNATRPRLPLPNETTAPQISSKENVFATMPRITFPKPIPTPIMSSTLTRYPNSNTDSPHTNRRTKRLPEKTDFPSPQQHLSTNHHIPVASPPNYRTLPKPGSPVEVQNKSTLLPSEPNHEIPVENELLRKFKKRTQLTPSSPQDMPVLQVTNKPTRAPPQQRKHEPYIHNELMQKLQKRAALMPDSENKRLQQPTNSAHSVQTPKSKPLLPTPRQSDYEDGWENDFHSIEPSEQIHMYNI